MFPDALLCPFGRNSMGANLAHQQFESPRNSVKMIPGYYAFLILFLIVIVGEGLQEKGVRSEEVVVMSPDSDAQRPAAIIWCALQNALIHRVTWYRFGKELHSDFYKECSDPKESPHGNVTCSLGDTEWDQIGEYNCTFNSTSNYTDQASSSFQIESALIEVKCPPGAVKQKKGKLVSMEGKKGDYQQDSIIVREGEDAEISCIFRGYPVPEVRWLTKEEDQEEFKELNLEKLELWNMTYNFTYTLHTLKMLEVGYPERKFYICEGENAHGIVHIHTLLRVKGKITWLWPMIGILAEVVIFGAIIFIVQYRENKRLQNQSDVDDLVPADSEDD